MRRFSPFVTVLSLLALLVLVGCQPGSPEEQVAAKRAQFTVELNSWYATVEEAEEEPMDEMAEGAEGEDAAESEEAAAEDTAGDEAAEEGAAGEGEDGEEMSVDDLAAMTGPQPHTVVFDLLVLYDGRGDALPGLTVKVTHADAAGTEKGSWLEYLELPAMTKGVPEQVAFQKEGVLFEEGEVFAVNLVKNVPAAERSDYREFQSAGN